MGRHGAKGVITVFLSLLSALFLSLACGMIESVRVQGARAQTAYITDMGNYSVFGEYEKKLLEDYEIFAVDVSYGSGDFSIGRVNDRLKGFLEKNAQVNAEGLSGFCFDPWQLKLEQGSIEKYTLLTDEGGEAFYQQAAAFMRTTAAMQAVGKLYEHYRDAGKTEEKQKSYEESKKASDQDMGELQQQEQRLLEEKQEQDAREGLTVAEQVPAEPEKRKNPLEVIGRLRKKGILELVCGNAEISSKEVSKQELASRRSGKRGNLKLQKERGGLLDDLLFREYLLGHFPNYLETEKDGKLDYQIEYIIAGKKTDEANLKSVVRRLLLLREGWNYAYCCSDVVMSQQAGGLAAVLLGWTGMPALVGVMKHGLLLGWAYGESLMDVRILLNGGKVPLTKDASSWRVTLDGLAQLDVLLEQGEKGGEGMDYQDYLRLLLNLQPAGTQKKRGLDLVELNLKTQPGLSCFRADHCMVAAKGKTQWSIRPVFSRASAVFLPVRSGGFTVTVESGFSYLT